MMIFRALRYLRLEVRIQVLQERFIARTCVMSVPSQPNKIIKPQGDHSPPDRSYAMAELAGCANVASA